jgi:thioredoxin reductase (NADPH)
MIKKMKYDLIIIGAGPAGLAASIYASRYGIKHLIIGRILGGQISETHEIDNYPGVENLSGFEFSRKWGEHVKKYGAEIRNVLVESVEKKGDNFEIELEDGKRMESRAVLLATGTSRRKLGIVGENEFKGRGVSYCATCDGFFYKNKTVAIAGGGDSAACAALHLAGICEKVYLIYRKNKLRAEPFWVNKIIQNSKIEIIFNTNILEITGDDKVEKLRLDQDFSGKNKLLVDGVFIEIGSDPDISYAQKLGVEIEECGCVKIDSSGKTSIAGVWAAGDITNGSDKFRQVITAASEGAIAARSIFEYLGK